MALPPHPLAGDIQVDDAFLTRIEKYFEAVRAQLLAQRKELTHVPDVRAGELAAGTDLEALTTTLVTTTGGEIDKMLDRIDWVIKGIAELRRNAVHGESVNQMSAAEVESFIINGG